MRGRTHLGNGESDARTAASVEGRSTYHISSRCKSSEESEWFAVYA